MAQPRRHYPEVVRRQLSQPSPFIAAAASGNGNLKFENVSYGQLQLLSAVPAQNAASAVAADQATSPVFFVETPIMEGRGVVKRFLNGEVHIVPMHAEWFCPTEVHNFERPLSSDAKNYMNFRNLIVTKYIQNPEKRLSINDCLELKSDFSYEVTDRIFRFLESWGIINYCADASPPDHESLSFGSYLVEDVDGAVQLPSAGLNSVDCLIKLDKAKCSIKVWNGDDMSELENRIMEKLAEQRCRCCSKTLLVDYYKSVKEDNVVLCLDCFHEGRFVVGHSSNDFSRLDSVKEDHNHATVDTWTDQETFLLLEAVEIYKDDWPEIADHVGSKSKAQCILHFLRMPLDNGLQWNLDVPTSNGKSEGSSIQDSESCNSLPFLNLENPVMALVAFLSSAFGPKVAAASAQAALSVLSNPLDEQIPEDGSHDETRNPGQHGDTSPIDGEMVKSAVKAGLFSAAIKAKLVADQEERKIQRYAAILTDAQLKKLDLKLTELTELDKQHLNEIERLEKARQKLAVERAIYMTKYQSLSNRSANLMPAPLTSYTSLLTGSGNQMNYLNRYMPVYQSLPTGNANAASVSNRSTNQLPASFTALLTGSEDQMSHLHHYMPTYQSLSAGKANAVAISNRAANPNPAPSTSFTALLTGSEDQMNHSNRYMPAYQSLSAGNTIAVAISNRATNLNPAPSTSFTALLTGSVNQMSHLDHYMPAYQSVSTGNANVVAISNRPANLMSALPTSFTALLTGSEDQMNHSSDPISFGQRLPSSVTQPSQSFQGRNAVFDPQGTGQSSFGYSLSSFIPGTSSQFS